MDRRCHAEELHRLVASIAIGMGHTRRNANDIPGRDQARLPIEGEVHLPFDDDLLLQLL